MNAAAEVTAYRATHSPCPHCRALFWMLNGIAARWTFARADEARIEAVAKALAVLFGAIDDLERLECDDA